MGIVDRCTPDDPAGRTLLDAGDMLGFLEGYAEGMIQVAIKFKGGSSEAAVAMGAVYEFAEEVVEVCDAAAHVAKVWHDMQRQAVKGREEVGP